jgi:hypothetical protein
LATDLKQRPGVTETDIVTSTRFGAFIFWGKVHPKKAAAANTSGRIRAAKHTGAE